MAGLKEKQQSNSEPVQVIVRIRPEIGASAAPVVVARDGRSVALLPPPHPPPDPTSKAKPVLDTKTFTFDRVLDPQASQAAVYECARPLVLSAVDGYNSTIFAYGHTGSGKTHTMMGTPAQPGMTPRAVQDMFALIQRTAAREQDTMFIVRMSYVELYNNRFRNLLEGGNAGRGDGGSDGLGDTIGFGSSVGSGRGSRRESTAADTEAASLRSSWRSMTSPPGSSCGGLSSRSCEGLGGAVAGQQRAAAAAAAVAAGRRGKIEVRECPEAGVFLSGPGLRRAVTSAEEVLRLVSKGDRTRATGATDCNERSSRSHAILSFHVESQRVSSALEGPGSVGGSVGGRVGARGVKAGGGVRLGKLHLVDLAGSERLSLSGAEGKRLHETQNINLSLSSLGDVLACLSRNATIASRRSSEGGNGDAGRAEALAPVPYRNSKLTHFLKDSLGGNSKTLMITTLRSTVAYHRQSLISLMYASRAKKIRNQSCVNVDTAGQSNIHQVSAEIETLKDRLHQRSQELNRLNNAHESGQAENASLRDKLQGLSSVNERERAQLEGKLSTVIHSQAGKLAVQHRAFVTLQGRLQRQLGEYQKKCILQQEEITHLRSTIQTMERETEDRVGGDEVQGMQRAIAAWQAQATGAQEELRVAARELEASRHDGSANKNTMDRLAADLKEAEAREKALLGYWRRLQAAVGFGVTSPMPAGDVIDAVHRLQEDTKNEAEGRKIAEKAKIALEKAAAAMADGSTEIQELERKAAALVRQKEGQQAALKELEAGNQQACAKLKQLEKNRADMEALCIQEEDKRKMVAERLSKVEESLNHALGVGELRQRLDEMIKARESAMTDATKARQEAQVATSTRDEALLSTNAMREKLNNFEGTLKGVSEEILRVLERKEAVLQGVEAERKQERAAYDEECETLRRSVAAANANASRIEADHARLKAEAGKEAEAKGAAVTAAAAAAASESAARARVAVAIGARQDAEKIVSGLRNSLKEKDGELSGFRQGLKKATKTIGDVAQELERSKAVHARSQEEHARYVATAVQKANHAAKLSAEADLDTARRREESLIGRLRETEKAAASERVRMDRELDEVREACEQLRARATAAEDKARGESERGKAKLAELIAQKDEMTKRLLEKHRAEHETTLATERHEAQHIQREAVDSAVNAALVGKDHDIEAALGALSAEKDSALDRALAAKTAEFERLQEEVEEATGARVAKAVEEAVAIEVAEAVAQAEFNAAEALREATAAAMDREQMMKEDAKKAEAMANELADKGKSDLEKANGGLATAEQQLASVSRESTVERERLQKALLVAKEELLERDTASADEERGRRLVNEAHERELEELREALLMRQEELAREARATAEAEIGAARAEVREMASHELEGVVERERDEARQAVEAAVGQKDREMAKALKAATRLARQNEQEAQASFDAERARLAGELEERLRSLKETHQKETLELRKQIERSALEVKGASEAAAATVTRVEIEKDEAVFEATCTAEDAIRAVSAEADEKVSALEEEVQRLREQLGSVPKALKAELEEEFGERGRVLREETQKEISAEAARLDCIARKEIEASCEEKIKAMEVSHEISLRDAAAIGEKARSKLVARARQAKARSEERCRAAEETASTARRDAQAEAAQREATERNAAAERLKREQQSVEATNDAVAKAVDAAVETIRGEVNAAAEEKARAAESRHRIEMKEALRRLSVEHLEEMEASRAQATRDQARAVATEREEALEAASAAAAAADERAAEAMAETEAAAMRMAEEKTERELRTVRERAEKEHSEREQSWQERLEKEQVEIDRAAEKRIEAARAEAERATRAREELARGLSAAEEHAKQQQEESEAKQAELRELAAFAEGRAKDAEQRLVLALREAEQAQREAERKTREERQTRDDREAREAQRLADEIRNTVAAAVGAERTSLERRHAGELEKVARAGTLAARVAAETNARETDDLIAAAQRHAEEAGEMRQRAAIEDALKIAAAESAAAIERAREGWEAERAKLLAKQTVTQVAERERAQRDAVQAALASLASEKDAALQAAVEAERRRSVAADARALSAETKAQEAEARTATAEADAAATQAAAAADAAKAVDAVAEAKAMAKGRVRQEGDDMRRKADMDVERRVRDEVLRVREETEVAAEGNKSRAAKELERLRDHASTLLENLRGAQTRSVAESNRARAASERAETLRLDLVLLQDEHAAMKEQAVRREEQHRDELAAAAEAKRAAELAEVAVREDMAVTVERLEASTREEREALAAETRESLLRALEEMDRQQSKVLSAALARSDAALGEVARVKEAMWNKAEENAEALREAFEAATERAAEEAEHATADALAKADREFRDKLAWALVTGGANPERGRSLERFEVRRAEQSLLGTSVDGALARIDLRGSGTLSRVEHEEAIRKSLAAERAEHARRLQAAMAERDAEALEALQILDAQHRGAKASLASRLRSRTRSRVHRNGSLTTLTTIEPGKGVETQKHGDHRRKSHPAYRPDSAVDDKSRLLREVGDQKPGGSRRRGRKQQQHPRQPIASVDDFSSNNLAGSPTTSAASAPTSGARGAPTGDAAVVAEAIRSAMSARDAALQEAKEQSDRLEDALSNEGATSEVSSTQPSATVSETPSSGNKASSGGKSRRRSGGTSTSGSPGSMASRRLTVFNVAAADGSPSGTVDEDSVMMASAPAWTIGSDLSDIAAESAAVVHGDTDGEVVILSSEKQRGDDWVSTRGIGGGAGVAANGDLPAVLRVSADAGGGVAAGADNGRDGGASHAAGDLHRVPGLTVTEARYQSELEGCRTRVRELEGMMDGRLHEKERMYRRKLRAAVAEFRTSKVRDRGAALSGSSPQQSDGRRSFVTSPSDAASTLERSLRKRERRSRETSSLASSTKQDSVVTSESTA